MLTQKGEGGYSFLASRVTCGVFSKPSLGRFYPGKRPRTHSTGAEWDPRSLLDRCGENILLPPVIEPGHVEVVVICYNDCAILVPLIYRYRQPSTVGKRIELSALLENRACSSS
jgi:hypothetical protein